MGGLACASARAQAQAQAQEDSKFRWFGSPAMSFGGDTLASGTHTSGQTFSIKAGDGVLLSGGVSVPVTNKLDLQGSVGYQSTSTNASNGKVEFTRVPLELLALCNMEGQWRLGGGARSATGAKLSTSGVASMLGRYEFTPSLGIVLEAPYFFDKAGSSKAKTGISVRYIGASFEEKVSKTKVNGDSLGVGFLFHY